MDERRQEDSQETVPALRARVASAEDETDLPQSPAPLAAPLEQLALVAAARSLGRDLERLAALRPASAGVVPHATLELDELLWHELERLERGRPLRRELEGREPLRYFLRRRDLSRRRAWESAAASLPRPWRRLAELPSAAVRERCIDLGVTLVAAAGAGRPAEELRAWLAPLGGPCARRVAERLVAWRERPLDPLAGLGREAYRAAREAGRRESSLLSFLGRRVLATIYHKLPAEQRERAGRIGRTNLLEILSREPALPLETPAQRERVEELVRGLLERLP